MNRLKANGADLPEANPNYDPNNPPQIRRGCGRNREARGNRGGGQGDNREGRGGNRDLFPINTPPNQIGTVDVAERSRRSKFVSTIAWEQEMEVEQYSGVQ